MFYDFSLLTFLYHDLSVLLNVMETPTFKKVLYVFMHGFCTNAYSCLQVFQMCGSTIMISSFFARVS